MSERRFFWFLGAALIIVVVGVKAMTDEVAIREREAYRQRRARDARACALRLTAARTNADSQRVLGDATPHWYGNDPSCAQHLAADTMARGLR